MRHVTRNVDPVEVHDLLRGVPRACVAFVCDDEPRLEPVTVMFSGGRYQLGMPVQPPAAGQEVVLLVDEGAQFFDLRAIYLRGHAQPLDAAVDPPDDLFWFAIEPARMVAWDYGRLRNGDDGT